MRLHKFGQIPAEQGELPDRPFERSLIVVGVKPGQDQRVWRRAGELAAVMSSGILCAYVDPASYLIEWTSGQSPGPLSLDPHSNTEIAEETAGLRAALARALEPFDVRWSLRIIAGDPAMALGRLAASCGASLLIVGSRRDRALARIEERISGSVALRLLSIQRRPVLAIPCRTKHHMTE